MRTLAWLLVPLTCLASLTMPPAAAEAIVADHLAAAEFGEIPPEYITAAMSTDLFYGHTSHGSQIVTGMVMLRDEDPTYDFNNGSGTLQLSEYGDDLGHNGDTSWDPITRDYLDSHPDVNMVMWSWCGGCSDNTPAGIDIYLNAMDALEQDYPGVVFVYMTGHLDGTGPDGNLYACNNQIRDYCQAHEKVLFDFADIESYDPDGTWYPWGGDICEWCSDWCAVHPCPGCDGCAHSHCFNCYLKGKAFWWMLARIYGWSGPAALADPGGHATDDRPAEQGCGALAGFACTPNLGSGAAELRFELRAGRHVRLELYSAAGRRITTLLDQWCDPGQRVVTWQGRDEASRSVARGTYYARLCAGGETATRKVIWVPSP